MTPLAHAKETLGFVVNILLFKDAIREAIHLLANPAATSLNEFRAASKYYVAILIII